MSIKRPTGKSPVALIGERIKQVRTMRGFSLRELSARADVSAAMISEVERGKKSPTIALVTSIANALAVPASYLFEREQAIDGISVVRRKEHRVVEIGRGAINVVLGHPIEGSNLHFVRFEARRGGGRDLVSTHPLGSIERAHVVQGTVELTVGDDVVRLEAGDSCAFLGHRPHRYLNVGRVTAKVYLVVEFGSTQST